MAVPHSHAWTYLMQSNSCFLLGRLPSTDLRFSCYLVFMILLFQWQMNNLLKIDLSIMKLSWNYGDYFVQNLTHDELSELLL